jgi:TonB family protein
MWGLPLRPDAPSIARARSVRLCRTLFVVAGFIVTFARIAVAEDHIAFNIPAQALDQALDAFGTASGSQIFYEAALTAGHKSTELKGTFDRETGLRILLSASGLTDRSIAANTITIVQLNDTDGLRQAKRAAFSYYGFIQTGTMKALCRDARTVPGTYRVTMQYWIDPSGHIAQLRLIGSSGDQERDDAIIRVMRTATFQAPMRNIPQPITLAIEPTPEDVAGCASDARIGSSRMQ